MKKIAATGVVLLAVISTGTPALTGCGNSTTNEPEELDPVEITEYEGEVKHGTENTCEYADG